MKKKFFIILLSVISVVCLAMGLVACGDSGEDTSDSEEETISVTSVILDNSSLSLTVGDSYTLTATVLPSNATNKNVTWSTSDRSVATISNGTVTAVAAGSATITVATNDGSYTAVCSVTVTEANGESVSVTSVSLNSSSLSLAIGGSAVLTATVLPNNATNKAVTWSSSNSSVAIVSDGTVTAVSSGIALIMATTSDGGKIATCTVTVTENSSGNISVTSVSLNSSSLSLTVGNSSILTATVLPSDATNKTVTWATSNSSVATVSDGTVTAVAAGMAVIIVTTSDGGKIATCTVTVKDNSSETVSVTSVSLNSTTLSLTVGKSSLLTATVLPSGATNKNVTWASSDSSVATVDNGTVTAVAAGAATISVTTEDGHYTAICTVTVTPASSSAVSVTSVSLDKTALSLALEEYSTITATILPSNATNKNISWSSTDTAVATVSDGKITAVGAGTAIITVTTEDGGKTASCVVTVTQTVIAVTSITLDETELNLEIGDSFTLTATILPGNAADKTVSWSSTDTAVATVADGAVTGVSVGMAVIIVTTEDGGKIAICTVTVTSAVESVTSVSLDCTALSLTLDESYVLTATVLPENATNKNLSWSSSNTAVATVTNGTVKAIAVGTATITVKTEDGGYSAACSVTVAESDAVLEYTLSSNNSFYNVTGCSGTASVVEIPNVYNGLRVCGISASAFNGNTYVKQIILPNTIQSIGEYAFYGCTNLKTINIPESVSSIGAYAFAYCNALTTLTDSDNYITGVETVERAAFGYCTSLTKISFDSSLTSIGINVFSNCTALTQITFSSGLKTIGDFAFDNCTSLTSITLPNSVTSVGVGAFRHAENLKSVTLSTGMTAISNAMFQYCVSLESIDLLSNITSVGTSAFSYCSGLKDIKINGNLTAIGDSAFYLCTGIESIYYCSSGTADIGAENYIFYDAGIKGNGITLTISSSGDIPEGLFEPNYEENLPYITSIVIETGVTSITYFSTYYNLPYLKSVTIPSTVTSICNGFILGCENVIQTEDGVKYLGTHVVGYTSALTSVSLREDTEIILDSAFKDCTTLTDMVIPESVTYIGSGAFSGCSGLVSMTLPFVGSSLKSSNETYQYPFGYIFGTSSYTGGTGTSQSYYGSSTSSTTSTTYYIPTSLTTVTITDSYLLRGAFYGCSNLTTVTIGEDVSSIAAYAFYNCSKLNTLTIGEGVTSIGTYAFYNCSGLNMLTIGEGVTSIGTYAFYDCTGLTVINYNATTVTDLSSNNYVFYKAGQSGDGITVNIGANVTKIPAYIFAPYSSGNSYAPNITSVVFAENSVCTSIGNYAFDYCSSLESVNIPASIITIGYRAFYNCSSLASATFANTEGWGRATSSSATSWTSISSTSLSNGSTAATYLRSTYVSYYWHRHNYVAAVTAPTCTEQGYTTYTCSICGDSYVDDYTDPAHTYVAVVTAPTCTEQGYTTYTCSVCGDSYVDDYTDPAHSYVAVVTAPTCTEQGYTTYTCSICGGSYTDNYTSAAHDYVAVSDGQGNTTYTCSVCGNSNTVEYVLSYELSQDETYYIVSGMGTCSETEIIIPSVYNGLPVKQIASNAFYGNSTLTSVIIGKNVTTIGENAFYDCTSLASITIGGGVTSIKSNVFYNTAYYNDTNNWANGVLYIGSYLIKADTSLSSAYSVISGTTLIADSAFASCTQLTAVYVCDGCKYIGYQAFANCTNLKTVCFYQTVMPVLDSDVFAGTWDASDFAIYVTADLYSDYQNLSDSYWQNSIVTAGKLYTIS